MRKNKKNSVKVGFFSFYVLVLAKEHEKRRVFTPAYARERFLFERLLNFGYNVRHRDAYFLAVVGFFVVIFYKFSNFGL